MRPMRRGRSGPGYGGSARQWQTCGHDISRAEPQVLGLPSRVRDRTLSREGVAPGLGRWPADALSPSRSMGPPRCRAYQPPERTGSCETRLNPGYEPSVWLRMPGNVAPRGENFRLGPGNPCNVASGLPIGPHDDAIGIYACHRRLRMMVISSSTRLRRSSPSPRPRTAVHHVQWASCAFSWQICHENVRLTH